MKTGEKTLPRRSWVPLLALVLACGSDDKNNSNVSLEGDSNIEPAPLDSVPGNDGNLDDSDDQPPPTEVERESSYRAPVVTGKYVWSANPDSGRVAAIDAETFEVLSAEAGLRPTHIAAVNRPDAIPRALVINVGSNDATLLTVGSGGAIETAAIALHQGADSWSVSASGRFAVAWTDSRKAARLDPTDGFQDITVIELPDSGAPIATRLTVGYRPSNFAFDAAGTRAFAITEDGISVIELSSGGARSSTLVPLPSRLGIQPDVSVSSDGARALARLAGSSSVFDIDLATGQLRELDLGAELTDLDLSEDGTLAVAVIRGESAAPAPSTADAGAPDSGLVDAGSSDPGGSDPGSPDASTPTPAEPITAQAVFITLPGGLTDASQRQVFQSRTETFGSVALSPDGAHAVLFTTARPSGRVTLLGPGLEARSVDLFAAVRAVFVTADGSHALALQDPAAGSLRKGAFSVLSLANVRAPKLVASDAPAEAVALTPNGSDRAVVTVSDPSSSVFGSFLVRMPNLQVDFASLPSRPLATGMVPGAGKAFVAQAHPEGRITFIDLSDGQGREITGFELSSKVVEE